MKVTTPMLKAMREDRERGMTYLDIAILYGVSASTVMYHLDERHKANWQRLWRKREAAKQACPIRREKRNAYMRERRKIWKMRENPNQ